MFSKRRGASRALPAALASCLLGGVVGVASQESRANSTGDSEGQRPDFEARMRIARADAAFAETRQAAEEMTRLAAGIAERVGGGGALERADTKTIDRIKKLARRVRTDLGGGGAEVKLEEPPQSARDAAIALGERATQFRERFSDASRYGTDARLITLTSEIMLLSDALKAFGAR